MSVKSRKVRGSVALFAVGITAAALVSACGASSGNSTASSKQVVIGMAIGETGPLLTYDLAAKNGAELAVADINAHGGLLGHPVKLITADTHSDINQGSQAGLALVSEGANVMLTSPDYNFGGGAARVAQQHNMVVFSAAGSSKFGPTGIGPLAYTTNYSVTSEGYVDAEWAYTTKHFAKAYVLEDATTDAGLQQCAGFTEHFKQLGGTIIGSDTFKNTDASIATQITKLKAAGNPDVILLCSYPPGGATAVQQLRAAGLNQPIIGEMAFDGTYWFKQTMPMLSNFYYVTPTSTYGDDPSPAVNEFWSSYKGKYGTPSVSFGVNYYAAVEVIAAAIKEAGTTSGAAVSRELDRTTKSGLLSITYTPSTHILVNIPMRMMQVQNGKPSYLATVSLSSAPPLP